MNPENILKPLVLILNKPFPFEYDFKNNIYYSLFFGLFVAAFLIIFQPFGINEDEPFSQLFLLLPGYGLLTALIMYINTTMLNIIFLKNRNESDWKVKHELLFICYIIFSIAIANTIYNSITENFPLTFWHFFTFTYQTFLVGFIPMMVSVLIIYNRKLKRNLAEARKLNDNFNPQQQKHTSAKINITAETGKDNFTFNISDLYFIKSAGNYVEIFYSENSAIKSKLIRTSLKKLEELLSGYQFIFKCHRTYIVNLDKVKNISGNSQGYLLNFENSGYSVPVARSLNKELKKHLHN